MIKEKLIQILILSQTQAQTPPSDGFPKSVDPVPGGQNLTVAGIIVNVVNFILSFAAALAVLMIVIGGIRYITSAGNEEALKQGRNIIIYAIVGLVVIILSFVIVNFVLTTTPVIVPQP